MKTNLLQKISVKLVAAFISIALLITGVCYIGIEGNVVQAATLETAVTTNGEGYYVKDYTGAEFNAYKNEGTYPKMVTETDDDVQEWLFAGWYQEKDATNGTCTKAYDSATTAVGEDATVYAKFVPASVMAVKCQVTPGTNVDSEKANMRLISTTDSADYTRMGFHVVYRGKLIDCYTTTLYKRVAASDDGMECNYSANAFDTASNYFFAVRLTNIGNANFAEPFYIEPYWVTADGTTVTGVSRYARVEDSYKKIVNIPVRLYSDEQVTNGEVSLSYNATQFELYGLDGTTKKYGVAGETKIAETVFDNVTYTEPVVDTENMATIILTGSNTAVDEDTPAVTAHGIFANVRLQLKEGQLIESNTSFKVADETFTNKNSESSSVTLDVANVIYKNYTMDYTGGSDTSWYDEFAEEDTFVISTAADLYGLAKIVNDTTTELYKNEQFSGKTIKLGADITINKGKATTEKWDTTQDVDGNAITGTEYTWTPIGNNSSEIYFEGTFDGQDNAISGLVVLNDTTHNGTARNLGLFGVNTKDSIIRNVSLKNSYIFNEIENSHGIGSIVGYMRGQMYNVSSDAIIISSTDANSQHKTQLQQVGGLIGMVYSPATAKEESQAVNVENCWFDGKIVATNANDIGGICGSVRYTNKVSPIINFTNCLFTGKITSSVPDITATGEAVVGGILGRDNASACTVNITTCLSAGELEVEGDYVGTLLGKNRSGSYTITNCYTTIEESIGLVGTGSTTEAGTVEIILGSTSTGTASGNSTPTSLDGVYLSAKGSDGMEGHYAYANANLLDYYTNADKTGAWVVTESGIPALKSFCDEWIDVAWYYDSVTDEADTFVIYTAEELYGFSAISQNKSFSGDTIKLAADIEMNVGKADSWYAGTTTPKRTFTPIGKGTAFEGNFDGKYNEEIHTISGLYVNSSKANNGLFGSINSSTLENFKLINSYVINSGTTSTTAGNTAGVVGKIEDSSLSKIYCEAIVTSAGVMYTGGITGTTNGTENSISSCWFNGTVAAKGRWAGGLVGRVSAGELTVENCISEGKVSSDSTNELGANAGGLFGSVTADDASSAIVKNTLSLCEVTAKSGVGAIVGGINQQVEFENVYTIYDVGSAITGVAKISDKINSNSDGESVKGEPILLTEAEIAGENAYIYTDFDFDNVWGVVADGTPVLRSLYDGNVESDLTAQRISTNWYYNNTQYDSTLENSITSYEIQDVNDLFGLARLVNGAKVDDGFAGKTVQLAKNGNFNLSPNGDFEVIANEDNTFTYDKTKTSQWTPIGTSDNPFKGNFEGNGNTISSVYVRTTTSRAGLFGEISDAAIRNFRLENSYFYVAAKVSYVATIAGYASDSTLENIYSNACLNATNNRAEAGFGGLVGYYDSSLSEDSNIEAQISNCWFDGTILSVSRFVGGLIGRAHLGTIKIENCLNSANITSTNVATGSSVYVGGLVGGVSKESGTVSLILKDCMQIGTVSATSANLDDANDDSVGTVLGRAYSGNTKFENVYTTTSFEDYEVIAGLGNTSNPVIITGQPKLLSSQELSDENAYYVHTDLDFYNEDNKDGIWALTEDGVPVLKDLYTGNLKENINSDRICTGWYYNNASYDKSMVDSNVDYSIATAEDLRGLAKLVNDGTETFAAAILTEGETSIERAQRTITLTDDISLNDGKATDWETDESTRPETSWTPIGGSEHAFQGIFTGVNTETNEEELRTIKGIYINSTKEDDYLGLFGRTSDATISNLKITNSYYKGETVSDYGAMGSIVGVGDGTIENIYSDAILDGVRIVGGIVGRVSDQNYATNNRNANTSLNVLSCSFAGEIQLNVSGKSTARSGGIVGYALNGETNIDTCLYTGELDLIDTYSGTTTNFGILVGGICGCDNGTSGGWIKIKNSLSAGELHVTLSSNSTGSATDFKEIGSVVGKVQHVSTSIKNVYAITQMTKKIKESTANKITTTITKTDSITDVSIDNTWTDTPTSLYGLGTQVATNLAFKDEDRIAADSEITGEEVTVSGPIWAAVAGQLPVPATLADHALDVTSVGKIDKELTGEGTETNPYLITTVEELYGFAQLSQSDNYEGDYISLGADILIYDELPWFCPISTNTDNIRFAGTFDGQNPDTGVIHTISGINAKMNASRLGLFAATEVGSTVKNLRLTDSYFEQTGDGIVGSIAAECRGAIDNVYSDATIVTSAEEAGGIVARANGYNKATDGDDETAGFTDKRISSSITNCWFDGTITSDKQYVGGIIASTRQGAWTMSNCLFTGTIYDNYTGSENAYIGGLCGEIKVQSIAEGEGSKILTSLDVQSCISTGTIHTTVLEKGIGSVVGRLSAGVAIVDDVAYENYTSLNMENVFVTRGAGSKVVGSIGSASNGDYSTKAKVIGYATLINNADRFIGYCLEEAVKDRTKTYEAATLDFTSESPAWILRTDGVPVPATFADMVNKVADYQLLNSEIGLTYLNDILNKPGDSALSIEKAVNQGVGNYVLSVEDVTLDTYKDYLEELKSEELGFNAYVDVDFENPVGTADDGVYNAIYTHKIADTEQVDWILNVLYVDSTQTMSITITSDESTLSPNLVAPTETTSTDEGITFAMLQLDGNDVTLAGTLLYTYGSSYVFQLPDGDFIINDGGSVSGNDFNGLITFLAGLAGAEITAMDENGVVTALDKDINIEAWTVSHQHNDHIGVLRQFMVQEVAKQIHVEAFYISEPNNRAIHIEDFTASSDDATFLYQELELQYQGMRMLTKSDGKTAPDVYRYQTGQRYYFDGITMDVVQSQEIIPVGNYGKRNASANLATDYNTASGTLLYTIQDGGQKILISGDANHKNMEYIMEMYGSTDGYTDAELLRGIDVFTALHHGKNSSYTIDSEEGYKTYTDYFLQANETFAVTLFPCSVYYGDKVGLYNTDYAGAFPYAKDANDYLKSKSTNPYNYGNGNVVFTLKTDGTIVEQ